MTITFKIKIIAFVIIKVNIFYNSDTKGGD